MLVLIVVYVFQGEECLAAHCQCSNRGVMPFAHWRVSPPPKRRRGALPVQQCRGNPPLHTGGFFGKRGSVSALQRVASIAMEGRFSLACWRSPQPVQWGRSAVQHVASAAIQRQLLVVYLLLNFWFFSNFEEFPILAICC